jgi:hypothetical protein
MSTAVDHAPDQLDDFTRAEQAAEYIVQNTRLRPKIAVVLGSGLGRAQWFPQRTWYGTRAS